MTSHKKEAKEVGPVVLYKPSKDSGSQVIRTSRPGLFFRFLSSAILSGSEVRIYPETTTDVKIIIGNSLPKAIRHEEGALRVFLESDSDRVLLLFGEKSNFNRMLLKRKPGGVVSVRLQPGHRELCQKLENIVR